MDFDKELSKLHPAHARTIKKIVSDLNRIDGYETLSLKPWRSNLPEIMPFVGQRMEREIITHLEGVEIMIQDQERRNSIAESLSNQHDEYGNPLFSTKWIEENIIKTK